MNDELKQVNDVVETLVKDANFKITMIELIDLMVKSGDCSEYIPFYTKISNALMDGEEVSLDEKKHFLAMHKSLLGIKEKLS